MKTKELSMREQEAILMMTEERKLISCKCVLKIKEITGG